MKRDMDFVRALLIRIENGENSFGMVAREHAEVLMLEDIHEYPDEATVQRLEHHLWLLEDAGLIEFEKTKDTWYVNNITWAGHDFLDSVRDDEIWRKTKEGALAAGGFTVDLLKDLAKGLIKKQINKLTDVEI